VSLYISDVDLLKDGNDLNLQDQSMIFTINFDQDHLVLKMLHFMGII